jgi:hypothetical protein
VASSDNKFVALGPAAIGFSTSATRIDTGVDVEGRRLGVLGRGGPVGVEGRGTDFGVRGIGESNGRGGEFSSSLFRGAQINLRPHRMISPGATDVSTPRQFTDPRNELPSKGKLGDLWVSDSERPDLGGEGVQPQCHLWLCVRPSGSGRNAQWAQILLGTPFEGRHPLPVHP